MLTISHYNKVALSVFAALFFGAITLSLSAEDAKNIFEDRDQDGLSNAEEVSYGTDPNNADTDGDSYSDGVEVESGYDPLRPAPGDRIVQERVVEAPQSATTDNLTEAISKRMVAQIATAQQSGGQEINEENIDAAINQALEETTRNALPDTVDLARFIIKPQQYDELSAQEREARYKADMEEYFSATSYVLFSQFSNTFFEGGIEAFAVDFVQKAQDVVLQSDSGASRDYFVGLVQKAGAAENFIYDIPVPERIIDVHTRLLTLLANIQSTGRAALEINVTQDPLGYISVLTRLQTLLSEAEDFTAHVTSIANDFNLANIISNAESQE